MRTVHIGVLGCASIARRRVLPALVAEPSVRLVAVASRTLSTAREVAARFGCAAIGGYDELLARDDIEAVYVPLPAALHAEWADRALRAGKHVLVEKPLTTSLARTVELIAAAGARGLVVQENFMFLYHHQHERVRRLLAAGVIGRLREFSAEFTVPPLRPDDIRYRPDLGGGALLDVGVYPLRAAQHFLGAWLTVREAVLRHDPRYGVDVGGTVVLGAPDGTPVRVTFGLDGDYRARYELRGDLGTISLDRAYSPPADHRPLLRIERGSSVRELVLPPDDQYRNAVRAFTTAVRSGPDRSWPRATVALAALVGAVRRESLQRPASRA